MAARAMMTVTLAAMLGLFAVSAGAMISSGLFVLPAVAFAKSGPALILAYLLASIFVIPAMLSKAELSTAMPRSGGVYFFITTRGLKYNFLLTVKSVMYIWRSALSIVLSNFLDEEDVKYDEKLKLFRKIKPALFEK